MYSSVFKTYGGFTYTGNVYIFPDQDPHPWENSTRKWCWCNIERCSCSWSQPSSMAQPLHLCCCLFIYFFGVVTIPSLPIAKQMAPRFWKCSDDSVFRKIVFNRLLQILNISLTASILKALHGISLYIWGSIQTTPGATLHLPTMTPKNTPHTSVDDFWQLRTPPRIWHLTAHDIWHHNWKCMT